MKKKVSQSGDWKSYNGIIAAILFVFAYFIARLIVKNEELAQAFRIMVVLLPIAPFVWMLYEFIKGVRGMDELEQRIQLEAFIIAYPLSLILLLSLGLLEIVIELPPEDFSYRHVWAMLPMFYFIGLFIARRRYS